MEASARTERKVKGLRREVPDDVGGVTSPEGEETLVTVGTRETVTNTLVGLGETTLLDLGNENSQESRTAVPAKLTDHLILVLNEELDTLNGSSGRFGDGLNIGKYRQRFHLSLGRILTAETPPIMKSTEQTCQVSISIHMKHNSSRKSCAIGRYTY